MDASLVPEPFVKHSCSTKSNKASKAEDANSHTKPDSGVVFFFGDEGLLFGLGALGFGFDLLGGDGVSLGDARFRCVQGAPLPPVAALLEGAASAYFAQPGDAVEVVGGHGFVLLLNEAKGRETEAGTLAVSVLDHGGQLVPRAGDKQVEEAGVRWQWGDGGVAPVKQDVVLPCQVGGLDLDEHTGPQFNSQLWNDHGSGVVGVTEQLHR